MSNTICTSILVLVSACSYVERPDPPELTAIHPAIARAGDIIMLEGAFSPTTMVHFPGGTVASVTWQGPHRASVVVPDTARDGELFVRTGDTGSGSVAFRRVGFGPALQGFRAAASPLRIPRAYATAVLVKNTLYVLGGRDAIGSLDSIERAQLQPDGTLGSFTLDSVALVKKRRDHAAVVLGDELYVLGGRTADSSAEPSIEVAQIAPDGSLGSFAIVNRSLTSARAGHTSVVIGNMLHVLGGLPFVEHAQVGSSSLRQFDPPEDSTATNRTGAATAVFGDALCFLGGYNGDTFADVVCTSITKDGLLGEFTYTFSLAVPRARSASVVVGPWLYLFGGAHIYSTGQFSMFYDDVVRIGPDDAGTFEEVHEPSRITARMGSVAAVVGSSVCVIGGYASNGSGIYLDTVECAAFAPN